MVVAHCVLLVLGGVVALMVGLGVFCSVGMLLDVCWPVSRFVCIGRCVCVCVLCVVGCCLLLWCACLFCRGVAVVGFVLRVVGPPGLLHVFVHYGRCWTGGFVGSVGQVGRCWVC